MKNPTFTQKLLVTTFCIFSSMLFLKAQESDKFRSMGGGGFTVGYGNMNVSELHRFVPEGVKTFKKDQFLIGGEGHGIMGNIVIGGSGFAIIGDNVKTDAYNYNMGGGIGTFDFGYVILNRNKVKIYPIIGIGGGGYGLQITRNQNVSVSDILNMPEQEINIDKGGLVGEVSVTISLIPVLHYEAKENAYGGFMAGLKIGYIFSPSNSNWSYSGGDITGGPEFGLNMAYVKLIIGGFGYHNSTR